jgi:Flp pilus assembly protein TadG
MFTLGTRLKNPLRRCAESGAAALELGLAAPFMVMMAVAGADLGLGVYEGMQAQSAAEAGAVYASIHGAGDVAGISSAVASATSTSGITATPGPTQFCGCPTAGGVATVDCSSTCGDGTGPGQYLRINAQLTHHSLMSRSGISLPTTLSGAAIVRMY